MIKNPDLNAVENFKRAVIAAFPNRPEIEIQAFDGSPSQAWDIFAKRLSVTEDEMVHALAPIFGIPAAGPMTKIEPEALGQLTFSFCQENHVLPLRIEDDCLIIATSSPGNGNVVERVEFIVNMPVRWRLAGPQAIDDAAYAAFSREAGNLVRGNSMAGWTGGIEDPLDSNAIVKLGRALMTSAIRQRASDMHIQPFLGGAVVRIRVDGHLRRLTMLPDAVAATLIRHIKARSGMESTNAQVPQDGRMALVIDDREFDLRVSSLPASLGERIVVRFLDRNRVHRLSGAGFSLAALQVLRRMASYPSGMIVFTGPTGSGKTSTLYGMLSELNRSNVNIVTVENPVEYRLTGISQIEVNEKAGRGFSAALRSMLRQDPDILLIGEIRDRETAEIAAQAALTGHLVLTSLHTNDAMTAIPRLVNLGLEPSIVADSLVGIVSQRLCRQLCNDCKLPVAEPLTAEERLFQQVTRNVPGHRPAGCKACNFTGYFGRLPIVDIVEMDSDLRDLAAIGEIRIAKLEAARRGGLKSLAASGAQRIVSGETTVAEVSAAVGPAFWNDLATYYGNLFPEEALNALPLAEVARQGVLLICPLGERVTAYVASLGAAGYRLIVVPTREQATQSLQQDEEIVFIVSDQFSDSTTPQEAASTLQENRRAISWARLPAIVVLPPHLKSHREWLRESGVLGSFLPGPVDFDALLRQITRSQAN